MSATENGETRQAIAQALWVADEGPKRVDEWWDAGEYEAVRAACYKRADAVLDRLQHVGWMGPYGIVPGGLDVEPNPNWQPLYMGV
jgi:hypothetical protein